MADYAETHSVRDQALERAELSRSMEADQRRRYVLGELPRAFAPQMTGEPLRDLLFTEAEIFERAYGDATGKEYWFHWLSPPDEPDETLIRLLATHKTLDWLTEERESIRRLVAEEKISLSGRGYRILMVTESRIGEALKCFSIGAARDRIAQIAASPKTRHLLPTSLCKFLEGTPSQARPAGRRRGRGGRPPAADWPEIQKALWRELDLVGLPRKDGPPEWRSMADVERYVEKLTGADEPGKTALRVNTKRMVDDWRKKKAGNQFPT
jgi:hypothetical protein